MDAGLLQRPASAGKAGDGAGGEGRAGDDGDIPVAQIYEVADGQISADFVVADRGRAFSVRAQDKGVGYTALAEEARKFVIESGRSEDEAVNVAVEEGFGGPAFVLGIVAAGGDHGEVAAAGRSSFKFLEHECHHGVAEARHQNTQGPRFAPAQAGGEGVPPVPQLFGDLSDVRCRG
ncbi:hypothetical protein D9M72_454480 [compost metagenome]